LDSILSRAGLALALIAWALSGGAGCLGGGPPKPTELCPGPIGVLTFASPGIDEYHFTSIGSVVDARGVDWVGQENEAIELHGTSPGCFQGGRMEGTWDVAEPWETYHETAAVSVRTSNPPMRVHAVHAKNYGDGVSIEPDVPCPNGSLNPWLYVRSSHLEDLHDDAIESDGLCAAEVFDNLIERTFVGFGFRNRSSEPDLIGNQNKVVIDKNLVRLHAFPNNYDGGLEHGGFWKWPHDGRGPRITVRNNRFLAFDAPSGVLFPYLNHVSGCSSNVLLFAGTEAEWAQALAGGCDDNGNDGVCDGERLLALSYCYSVITKPDTQSEADFLATHWDPHVASWKASHIADGE
jgi:hypothetical protein